MPKPFKTVWKDSDNNWHSAERDSMNESVYGYITMANYNIRFDTVGKLKAFRQKFPYTFAPNWQFTKNSTQYVGIEELTALSQDQITYANINNIVIVGTSSQFNEWLQATTMLKMVVHKVKQSYRAVKEWIIE